MNSDVEVVLVPDNNRSCLMSYILLQLFLAARRTKPLACQPKVTNVLLQCFPGQVGCEEEEFRTSALFNTVFENSSTTSGVAQCGGCKYLLPKLSKFLIVGGLFFASVSALPKFSQFA